MMGSKCHALTISLVVLGVARVVGTETPTEDTTIADAVDTAEADMNPTMTPTPTPEENFDCPKQCLNRGACVGGHCYCLFPYTGLDCSEMLCEKPCHPDHGTCQNGTCICDYGYGGPQCKTQDCSHLYDCNSNGACNNGICECYPGFFGPDCAKQKCQFDCYNNGECDQIKGKAKCRCDMGWTGEFCSIPKCLNNCNGNGTCIDGVCQCFSGYTGTDCATELCDVCEHGECVNGHCICADNWEGPGCDHEMCPENCNDNGVCVDGACVCNPGWDGRTCTDKYCPLKCNYRGTCVEGICQCNKGFQGVACDVIECPGGCQDHGKCVAGYCSCFQGYEGKNCEVHVCPNRCSGHGTCRDMVCTCDESYYGFDCSRKECPDHCSGHGQCNDGECICYNGWMEDNCGERRCKNDCNGNGACDNGVCQCLSTWKGEDCSQRTCPDDCNFRGKCIMGFCKCQPMYTGDACEMNRCINDCSGHGVCNQTTVECECTGYWFGVDCSQLGCPEKCNHHGSCEDGFCTCHNGYSGNACQYKACPNQCNKHGDCNRLKGECECYDGWAEVDCSRRSCPADCNGRALACLDGVCKCQYGWEGQTCETRACLDGCEHGSCINGMCVCDPGWGGKACHLRVCPDDCSGHGICDIASGECGCDAGWWKKNCGERDCVFGCINGDCNDGNCDCFYGWGGVSCDSKACPNDCNDHGTCTDAMCTCDEGWKGEDCSVKSCKFDCHDQGACRDGVCECYNGFEGDTCEFKKCPADCNFRGSCNKYTGQCTCMQIWKGSACELPNCPATTMGECHGHGVCKIGGYCECDEHWRSDRCDLLKCPHNCHLHGICGNGTCGCYEGYFGVPCDRECPSNCTHAGRRNGNCINEQCVCDYWHYGPSCGQICDQNCTNRGECMEDDDGHGYCDCEYGYTGQWCEEIQPCPGTPECYGHGTCHLARCTCSDGWGKYHNNGFDDMAEMTSYDNDCSEKLCLNSCSQRGTCEAGECVCREGYSGEDCSFTSCPNDCSDHGVCKQPDGTCQCYPGFLGADCSEDECPNACSGHGTCNEGCCACDDGYTGVDCSLKMCPLDCSARGSCDYLTGMCTCFAPYYGQGCEMVLPVRDIVTGTEEVAFGYQPEDIAKMSVEEVQAEAMKHIVDKMSADELRDQVQTRLIDAIKDDPAALMAELKKRAGVATMGMQAKLSLTLNMGTGTEPTDSDQASIREQFALKAGVSADQVVLTVTSNYGAMQKRVVNLAQDAAAAAYTMGISISGLTNTALVSEFSAVSQIAQIISDAGVTDVEVTDVAPPTVAPVKGAISGASIHYTDAELEMMTSQELIDALSSVFASATAEELYSTVSEVYMALPGDILKEMVTEVATSEIGTVDYVEPYLVFGRVQVGSECPTGIEDWKAVTVPALTRVFEMIAEVPAEDIAITDAACHEAKVIIEYSVVGVTEDAATVIASKLLVGFQMGKFMWFMANEGQVFISFKMIADPLVVAPGDIEGESPFAKLYLGPKPNPRLPVEEPPMPAGELEAEVRSAIGVTVVCDMDYTTMPEWRASYEAMWRTGLGKLIPIEDGLHRIKIERVERGATTVNDRAAQIRAVILPPTEKGVAAENSMKEKQAIDDALTDGSFANMMRSMGIPCVDVLPINIDVETKAITDIKGRCKRCRNGAEQAEGDHREFTRKCSRDGSCKRATPFTVDDACAHGCADHCASTCKRFHATKEKVCLSRRRMHSQAKAMLPTEELAQNAADVTNLVPVHSEMKQSIKDHIEDQNFLTLNTALGIKEEDGEGKDGAEGEDTDYHANLNMPSELKVISTCFAECAQSCIEHCIGQWSDAIPEPERTLDALKVAEAQEADAEEKVKDSQRLVAMYGTTTGPNKSTLGIDHTHAMLASNGRR